MTEQNTVEDLIDVTSEFDISDMELHNGRLVPIAYKTRTSEYGTLDTRTDAVGWNCDELLAGAYVRNGGFQNAKRSKGSQWLVTNNIKVFAQKYAEEFVCFTTAIIKQQSSWGYQCLNCVESEYLFMEVMLICLFSCYLIANILTVQRYT